jgi:hypothetical protein
MNTLSLLSFRSDRRLVLCQKEEFLLPKHLPNGISVYSSEPLSHGLLAEGIILRAKNNFSSLSITKHFCPVYPIGCGA